jgi:hypothetical protein
MLVDPCRKSLWLIKITSTYEQKFFQGQILIPLAHSFYLLPYDSAVRIARELWWTYQEIVILPWFYMVVRDEQ